MSRYSVTVEIEVLETLRTAGELQKLSVAVADTVGQHFDHITEVHGVKLTPRGVEAMDFKVIS